MSNQEILEKAIQKAIDGGWYPFDTHDYIPDAKHILEWFEADERHGDPENYKLFIFNHDFAKALWGDQVVVTGGQYKYATKTPSNDARISNHLAWKFHLQCMVIADDPIKYLGENL